MDSLRERDLKGMLEVIERVGQVPDVATFHREALAGLHELVGCDLALVGVVDSGAGRGEVALDDPPGTIGTEAANGVNRNFHMDPILGYHMKSETAEALRTSDFMGMRSWLRTALYNEGYRPVEARHNMKLKLATPDFNCVALCRASRDFTERERDVLTALRPHLSTAHENAVLRERMCLEGNRMGVNGNGAGPAMNEGNGSNADPARSLDPESLQAIGLSPREADVLALVARGFINDAIGNALGISARTVQKHLEHVHATLGVGTRTAAVARARELCLAGD